MVKKYLMFAYGSFNLKLQGGIGALNIYIYIYSSILNKSAKANPYLPARVNCYSCLHFII